MYTYYSSNVSQFEVWIACILNNEKYSEISLKNLRSVIRKMAVTFTLCVT